MATRVDCLPRKIKRIKAQADSEEESKDDEKTYSFYRNIIYPSILRLNNEKGITRILHEQRTTRLPGVFERNARF